MNSTSMEIAGDLPRPATKVAGNTRIAHSVGKSIEQSTIQRFVLQLTVETTRILVRHQVIAGLNVARLRVNHWVRVLRILFAAAIHVLARGFLHHRFQRHVVFARDAAAVFIFRCVVGDGAVHAGNLDADVTPLGANIFPAACQSLPGFISPPHS